MVKTNLKVIPMLHIQQVYVLFVCLFVYLIICLYFICEDMNNVSYMNVCFICVHSGIHNISHHVSYDYVRFTV